MMNDVQTIFNIPAENLEKFEAEIAKLSRKAVKLGCEPIKPVLFGHHTATIGRSKREHRVYEVLLTFEIPRVSGWTFVARIDHANEVGNILRSVPNIECSIPETYRTVAPRCDHCNKIRNRRDTFLLHNNGEFKQVGSTCLKDFFGHDVLGVAKMAELLGYAYECGRAAEDVDSFGGSAAAWVGVEYFLTAVAWAIRNFGWVSGKMAYENPMLTSTRTQAELKLFQKGGYCKNLPILPEDSDVAVKAVAWAEALVDQPNKNDYEHNICVVAGAPLMEARSFGLAASIVNGYLRSLTKPAKVDAGYIGKEGERLRDLTVTVTGHLPIEGHMGTSHLYSFQTVDGAVVKWFSSNNINVMSGDTVTLTGTVKKHDVYRGVRQTVLTRCKAVKA